MLLRLLSFRSRGLKVVIGTIVVFHLFSTVYFHIPWSVRKGLYVKAPSVDRMLMRAGFRVMQGWDELALLGRDAAVPLEDSYRDDLAYGGYPSQGFKILGRLSVLENRGYVSGYSDSMKNPLWVSYRLFDVPKLVSGKRTSFKTDSRTRAKVNRNDYTHSGFDRGHMAPNYGIATRYGAEGQKETFLMTNIIPQNPSVNRGLWKEIEMREAKRYGRYFSEIWVITGPVFQEPVRKMESGIPIPSHYYKIIIDEHQGELRTLSFLLEEDCPPWTRMKKRLVSIDDIEHRTGLDFFPELSEADQLQLESEAATRLWPWLRPALQYRIRGKTN